MGTRTASWSPGKHWPTTPAGPQRSQGGPLPSVCSSNGEEMALKGTCSFPAEARGRGVGRRRCWDLSHHCFWCPETHWGSHPAASLPPGRPTHHFLPCASPGSGGWGGPTLPLPLGGSPSGCEQGGLWYSRKEPTLRAVGLMLQRWHHGKGSTPHPEPVSTHWVPHAPGCYRAEGAGLRRG